MSLADALFLRSRGAGDAPNDSKTSENEKTSKKKKRKENDAALRPAGETTHVIAATKTVDFIETRDAILRRSLASLRDVVEVGSVAEKKSPAERTETIEKHATGSEKRETRRSPFTRSRYDGGDTGLLYLVHEFKSVSSWDLEGMYDSLPIDPYTAGIGVGRFRAYSKFEYEFPETRAVETAEAVPRLDPAEPPTFFSASPVTREANAGTRDDADRSQSSGEDPSRHASCVDLVASTGALLEVSDTEFNPPPSYAFAGRADGVQKDARVSKRVFARIPPAWSSGRPEFKEICARFASYVRLDPRYAEKRSLVLGVHAIRIKVDAEGALKGLVVPEGVHHDGFEYIGLLSPSRRNVRDDWRTYVSVGGARGEKPSDDARPIFQSSIEPGAMLFMDDRRMWHDADDLVQADPSDGPGWRDFMVVTLAANDNANQH